MPTDTHLDRGDGAGTEGERLSTGVESLDAILRGGLIAERSYLVRGRPGAGKTILGMHYLTAGAAREETALFINLEEATEDVDTPGPAVITADEGWLRQLFENLFRNAVDHDGDDVTIRVGLLDDTPGIYVEDDGPGIPPTKREEVFEAGYTDADDGTGSGFSIAKQIVDGHDWTIAIAESDAGGARFEISNVDVDR